MCVCVSDEHACFYMRDVSMDEQGQAVGMLTPSPRVSSPTHASLTFHLHLISHSLHSKDYFERPIWDSPLCLQKPYF